MARYKTNKENQGISTKDLNRFRDQVDILAKKTFGVNWEGNHQLEIIISDLRQHHCLGVHPVPLYGHDNKEDLDALAESLRWGGLNATTTTSMLDRIAMGIERQISDKKLIRAGEK